MPILICRACKSYAGKAINYITDKKKAERITTYGLDENKSLSKQFINTAKMYGKGEEYNERKYYHIKISFEKKDLIKNGGSLDAELAEKIANDFLQSRYSSNEYVLAVHTDKEHIHAHAIINAVNFEDGKKIQHKNKDLSQMKDHINDISENYDISRFNWRKAVQKKRQEQKQDHSKESKTLTQAEKYIIENYGIDWSAHSWKETLRQKIDEAKQNCTNRTDFQKYLLDNYGVEMPRNTAKTVSFKHPAIDETVRGIKLGADYTAASIDEELQINFERSKNNAKLRTPEERTADSKRAITTNERAEQGRTGKLSTKGEFDGVHSTIREIEERTKHLSGTGREEIRARERTHKNNIEKYVEQYRELADRQRATEQQSKQRNNDFDIER